MRRVFGVFGHAIPQTLSLALLLACATLAPAAKFSRDEKIVAALAVAEQAATAQQWPEALAAGDRLRTLTRERHGEEHPDSALAELFLGEVRDQLGEPALAEAHLRRALAIQEKVLSPPAPELVTTFSRLAALLKKIRRYDESIGLLRRALEMQAKMPAADEIDTAVASTNLARVLRLKGDHAAAAKLLERAVGIQRRVLGGTDIETIAGLRELAEVQAEAGNATAAEGALAERTSAVEERFGAWSAEHAAALSAEGRFAEQHENLPAAEARYRRALEISEALLPANHPALAGSLGQLGVCLRLLERYDEAQPLLQRALDLRGRAFGPEHPETVWSYRELGWVLRMKREFEDARGWFEKALAVREKILGADHPLVLESLGELGDLHWLRGAFDEAAGLLETKRYRIETTTGPASPETAAAWHGLAIVYESAKRWPEATHAALRSLALTEQRLGPAHLQTLSELFLLSRICAAAGAFAPALTQYARLASWFRQHPEASPATRAGLLREFALATFRAGGREDAEPLFRESRQVHEIAFGKSHAETLRSVGDLWTFYEETRQGPRALETARELAALTTDALGPHAPATIEVSDRLGRLCLEFGERAEAGRWFRRALEARRRRFGDGSPELLEALARTAAAFEALRDFARAAELRTERLGALERKSGGDRAVAAACGELALCYFRQRDLAAARTLFERQLALLTTLSGAQSMEALTAIARLGDVAMAARDWPWAVRERERLAHGCARRYGAEHLEHGRALLLLGEALLARGSHPAAERSLREAHRLISAAEKQDATAARAACGLARAALRRGLREEARRWTQEALAGTFAPEEPLAEAFSLLGEEWARAGDDESSESALTGALMILTQATGDHDEHTLALLERLGTLRLRLGRPGAGALLERALAASEALHGAEVPATANVLGWLTLARLQEGKFAEAHASARRMLATVRKTSGEGNPHLAIARDLEAWAAVRVPGRADSASEALSASVLARWRWLSPLSTQVAAALASLRRGLAEPGL